MAKLNLEQFIKKAKQKEDARMKLGVYKSRDMGDITLKYLGMNEFMSMYDGIENKSIQKQLEVNNEIIYKSMPILHEQELLDAMGINDDPTEISSKVFSLDETAEIIEHLMKFNGIDISIDQVKN